MSVQSLEKLESWNGQNWMEVIKNHRQWYDDNEQRDFDEALRMYQGKLYTPSDRTRTKRHLVQFNMLFAVVESAVTALLPTNLRFTVDEVENTLEWVPSDAEKDLEKMARRGEWRGEGVFAITDAVLYGRYFLKVSGSPESVKLRSVRAQNVYIDMTARRQEDIGYYIECIPRTPEEIQKLSDEGHAAIPSRFTGPQGLVKLREMATNYPQWMSDAAHKTAGSRWIMTYEVTDVTHKQVSTWMEGYERPLSLIEGGAFWNPWVVGNLNNNGQDMRGLSEVQLVKDVIEAINKLLGYIQELVRRMVPVTLYASDRIDAEAVAEISMAEPGEFVAVNTKGASISDCFAAAPIPEVPAEVGALMQKLESVVSYVSALSDTARGQTTGARTATELALIESQQRTRLQSRSNAFQRAMTQAASKALLIRRQLPYEALPDLLEAVHLVASNAIEQSRAVLQEKFMQIIAYVTQRPDSFNMAELDRMFIDVFGAPASLLLSDEEKAAAQGAAAAQELPQAPPVVPAGPPPVPDTQDVAPQVATGKVAFNDTSPAQETA